MSSIPNELIGNYELFDDELRSETKRPVSIAICHETPKNGEFSVYVGAKWSYVRAESKAFPIFPQSLRKLYGLATDTRHALEDVYRVIVAE